MRCAMQTETNNGLLSPFFPFFFFYCGPVEKVMQGIIPNCERMTVEQRVGGMLVMEN